MKGKVLSKFPTGDIGAVAWYFLRPPGDPGGGPGGPGGGGAQSPGLQDLPQGFAAARAPMPDAADGQTVQLRLPNQPSSTNPWFYATYDTSTQNKTQNLSWNSTDMTEATSFTVHVCPGGGGRFTLTGPDPVDIVRCDKQGGTCRIGAAAAPLPSDASSTICAAPAPTYSEYLWEIREGNDKQAVLFNSANLATQTPDVGVGALASDACDHLYHKLPWVYNNGHPHPLGINQALSECYKAVAKHPQQVPFAVRASDSDDATGLQLKFAD